MKILKYNKGISVKKKIAHLTSVHARYDTRIFLKECSSLAKAGYDVSLVVADSKGNEVKNGVKIFDVGVIHGKASRILKTTKNVYKKALEIDADIYHFHDSELLPIGLKLKKRGKMVIYDSHEDFPRQIFNKQWLPKWTRMPLSKSIEFIEDHIVQRLDAIVCATPLIRDRFLKINDLSIDVKNYVLLEEFTQKHSEKTESKNICYVGALTQERGILQLLDAMDILKDARLLCCGPFESPAFEEKLKQHKSWKLVDYRGVVGRDEVAEIMQKSTVGLVTLLNTPNQIEALPIKLFEYMAAGLPAIASNFPLWEEIVIDNDCGLCVDPESPEEIAKAIRFFFENPDEVVRMGENGVRAVNETYNWQLEEKKLLDLYEGLSSDE